MFWSQILEFRWRRYVSELSARKYDSNICRKLVLPKGTVLASLLKAFEGFLQIGRINMFVSNFFHENNVNPEPIISGWQQLLNFWKGLFIVAYGKLTRLMVDSLSQIAQL